MTNEQISINIAIAELLGWTDISQYTQAVDGWYGYEPENGPHSQIPNFCNDLNAMHEAEKMLNSEQKEIYFLDLMCLYGKWPKSIQAIQATAKERAETFLKTLEKWEE